MVLDELLEEATLAAAQVEDPARPGAPQRGEDRAEPLLVQADLRLDRRLLGVAGLGLPIRVVLLAGDQPAEGFARQVRLAREVAPRDELALGMLRQPALAAAEQLLDLGCADPVVLLVVEHRDEHVQVGEQVLQADIGLQGHPLVRRLAPLREALVQRSWAVASVV